MRNNWVSFLLILFLATQSVWAISDIHTFHHDTSLDTAEHHSSIHHHDAEPTDSSDPQVEHHHHGHHHHSETQFMSSNWVLPDLNHINDLSAFYKTPKLSNHNSNLFRPPRT